jgi:sugar lactone lactonase YvrE
MNLDQARRVCVTLALAAIAVLAAAASAAAAGPPLISGLSVSGATETSIALQATLNPNGPAVDDYHFEYITRSAWLADGESFGEGTESSPPGALPAGSAGVEVSTTLTGLPAGTVYRYRLHAHNTKGNTAKPEASFATLSVPQAFEPCPNDAFRSGEYAPPAEPSAALPDCRAYERATPADKDGGDVIGQLGYVHAAAGGEGISFMSDFGLPGGQGAQVFPTFLAFPSAAGEGWSTAGLDPPATIAVKSRVIGWAPDFSATYANATLLSEPRSTALFELHPKSDAPPTQITPYAPGTESLYSYVGADAGETTVFFETPVALPAEVGGTEALPGALAGKRNIYAWDRASGRLSLVSLMNSPAEAAALANGSSAGAGVVTYQQDQHALAADGSIYFTSRSDGQLYRRVNPTQPQSTIAGGECTEVAKACTIHVSATEKTNGQGTGEGREGADSAGPAPATFQAASADGSLALFTSSEKLTDDANTGPEQPAAQIGRATTGGAVEPEDVREDFIVPAHALGMATSPDGHYLYWADPQQGTIARATLDPGTGAVVEVDSSFIEPGPTEAETFPETQVGILHPGPTRPIYVAAGPCAGGGECVYWTNTGPPLGESINNENAGGPVLGGGTIGRAKLNGETGEAEDVKPAWISGASNPEGIAVNSEHIYWANAGNTPSTGSIGRAKLDGSEANQEFIPIKDQTIVPRGLALSASQIYFSADEGSGGINGFVWHLPLSGNEAEKEFVFIGNEHPHLRGLAIAGPDLYWVAQGEGAIGRIPLADFPAIGPCTNVPSCETAFLNPQGTPFGLAADPAGHLYWSVNAEAPSNPGNDLYRYSAAPDSGGHHLTDLTADPIAADGAEVQGVLGASADGSRVYFAANGVLAANQGAMSQTATPGNCKGPIASASGHCNLYLSEEGQTSFIARLDAASGQLAWNNVAVGIFAANTLTPKTAFVSADGRTLLFRSQEQLTEYDNHGVAELYLYRIGQPLACLSCNPSGQAPSAAPRLGSISFALNLSPAAQFVAPLQNRNLTADGRRAYFESSETLLGADTNGAAGCPAILGKFPACQDVYEWEAPGTGSCSEAASSYSPQNQGCLYLLSSGTSPHPSFFADADETGENVFIFTRSQFVGTDTDSIQDVYDAREGGGLAAQNPLPAAEPCQSAEACKSAATPPPVPTGPATPSFQGPSNLHEKPCPKGKVRRHGRCVKKPHHHRRAHR